MSYLPHFCCGSYLLVQLPQSSRSKSVYQIFEAVSLKDGLSLFVRCGPKPIASRTIILSLCSAHVLLWVQENPLVKHGVDVASEGVLLLEVGLVDAASTIMNLLVGVFLVGC